MGKRFGELLCDEQAHYETAFAHTLADGEWSGELAHVRRDGSTVDTDTRWTLLVPDAVPGACQKILVIGTDISERKSSEAKIFRLAFFDHLTDLPNRANLLDQLRRALVGSARSGKCGALMFCDLDNFKYLNDSQGHAAGDLLLQAVARRLEGCVRETDMVARLGGDEFVVLIRPVDESRAVAAAQAETVARKVVAALAAPFQLGDLHYALSVSVGVVTLCGLQDTVESTLRQADAAMYQAKAAGRNTFRFHDPAAQAAWLARARTRKRLAPRAAAPGIHAALPAAARPLRARDRRRGAAALAPARWQRSCCQAEFIRIAEESGLIIEIGAWVCAPPARELARWQRQPATADLTLSVNVSARQFTEPDFVAHGRRPLLATPASQPARLKLELTESLVVDRFRHMAVQTMDALKRQGLAFSLDDFGTGYSSLAYLRKLPLDQLKIDQLVRARRAHRPRTTPRSCARSSRWATAWAWK